MGRGMRAGKVRKKKPDISKPVKFSPELREMLKNDVKQELTEDISEMLSYHHNIEMIGVMFALRDVYGFGKDRILRLIKKACEHSDRMLRDSADLDKMLDILKDETGITEEDMTWDMMVEVDV